MKITVMNTAHGLVPMYDEDFDEKRKLRLGQEYLAEIRVPRNLRFHRKYFSFLRCAYSYIPERWGEYFRSFDDFRYTVEIAAGYSEKYYNLATKSWCETHRSISFESMKAEEFEELYERVKDVVFRLIGRFVTVEEFERNLAQY